MRTYLVSMCALALLLLQAPRLIASEADELREKAQRAKAEAVELKKLGRAEESERAARQAAELMEAAGRLEGKRPEAAEQEAQKRQRHLEELLQEERRLKKMRAPEEDLHGIRERIAQTERELDELRAGRGRQMERPRKPMPGGERREEAMAKLEEAGRRIEHLRIAAKHLHEAGAHDLAEDLMQKAAATEREAGEAKKRISQERGFEPPPRLPEHVDLPAQVEELRREMGRLREELNNLRRQMEEVARSRR